MGINDKDNFQKKYPLINTVLYDGKTFPFKDKYFDICWSNAVIEHVGDFNAQLFFISEMKRVSQNVNFSTPNKHFPIELHTRTLLLHLLPKSLFDRYLKIIRKKWAIGYYMNLLTKRNIVNLLIKANVSDYKITGNKLFGFTMDYIVILRS